MPVDQTWMRRALSLALEAQNQTLPNPMVGAVLVSGQGELLSQGWHKQAGGPHAEVEALEPFNQVPADATLYVTLEPCNHQGRTGPCTDLLLKKGVKQLKVGTLDPNPKMQGQSVAYLESQGVQVETGIFEGPCRAINRIFNKHITTGLPYVTAKAAVTLDGKIANAIGASKWITGPESRAFGHQLRSSYQAIAVGAETLRVDNPRLTDRQSPSPRQPDRVVFSGSGTFNTKLDFFVSEETRRFLFLGRTAQIPKVTGITCFQSKEPWFDPTEALKHLYQAGICSLLLEGGSGLLAGFLAADRVDQLAIFYTPNIMGQPRAPGFAGDLGPLGLDQLPSFYFGKTLRLGEDLMIEAFKRSEDVYRID